MRNVIYRNTKNVSERCYLTVIILSTSRRLPFCKILFAWLYIVSHIYSLLRQKQIETKLIITRTTAKQNKETKVATWTVNIYEASCNIWNVPAGFFQPLSLLFQSLFFLLKYYDIYKSFLKFFLELHFQNSNFFYMNRWNNKLFNWRNKPQWTNEKEA